MTTMRKVRHAAVVWETKDETLDIWVSHLHHQGEVIDIDEIPEKRRNLLTSLDAFEEDTPEVVPEELGFVDDGLGGRTKIELDENGNVAAAEPVNEGDGFSREFTLDALSEWVGKNSVPTVVARIRENPDMADEFGQAEEESSGKLNRPERAGILNEVAKHGA
jgi:hypothetical protein